MLKKIDDVRSELQRERERTEHVHERSTQVETKLMREEAHTTSLLSEIDRLKRKIRKARPKSMAIVPPPYLDDYGYTSSPANPSSPQYSPTSPSSSSFPASPSFESEPYSSTSDAGSPKLPRGGDDKIRVYL